MVKKFLFSLLIATTITQYSARAMFKEGEDQTLTIAQIKEYHQDSPLEKEHEFSLGDRTFVITKITGNTALFDSLGKDFSITGHYFSLRREWTFTYVSTNPHPNEKTNSFSFSVRKTN